MSDGGAKTEEEILEGMVQATVRDGQPKTAEMLGRVVSVSVDSRGYSQPGRVAIEFGTSVQDSEFMSFHPHHHDVSESVKMIVARVRRKVAQEVLGS